MRAALGWTLGGEVHLFIADSDLTRRVYATIVGPHLTGTPQSFDSAFTRRPVVTLAAESLNAGSDHRDPLLRDVTVLSTNPAVPGDLRLVRLHAAGDCLVPVPVTELVYGFSPMTLPAAPPSHGTVVALYGRRTPPAADPPEVSRLSGERARRYIRIAALEAERLTRPRRAAVPWPLGDHLAVDVNAATDAGEAMLLGSLTRPPRVVTGLRVRFLEPAGDTILVSGVAIQDTAGRRITWIARPVRARWRRGAVVPDSGQASSVRYVAHGWVTRSGGTGVLLLVSLVMSTIFTAAGKNLQSWIAPEPAVVELVNLFFWFGVTALLFALIYKILPDVPMDWSDVVVGALVTSALFTIGKALIALYIGKSSVASPYGAAGSVVLILVWVYYSAQVVVLGAELTYVYTHKHGSRFRARLTPGGGVGLPWSRPLAGNAASRGGMS